MDAQIFNNDLIMFIMEDYISLDNLNYVYYRRLYRFGINIMSTKKFQTKNSLKLENNFSKYLDSTSPLQNLKTVKAKELSSLGYRNSIETKISIFNQSIKKKQQSSFSEMKASSVIYSIPQFSPPEINFEVSECIQKKVEEMKNDIVGQLPLIKSSNYYSKLPVEVHFRNRTAVIQLQEWLREKLKNPPLSCESSVQYKNMIMGIGMKELIRVLRKRCNEEGELVNQIWELTWSICRQIIVYLSKRAYDCERILEEQIGFMRKHQNSKMQQIEKQNLQMSQKLKLNLLQLESKTLNHNQLKLKFKLLREQNQKLSSQCKDYSQEYVKLLEENLNLYLKDGQQDKRDWVRKMYRQIRQRKNQSELQQNVKNALQNTLKTNVFYQSSQINDLDFANLQVNLDLPIESGQQQTKYNILQVQFATVNKEIQTQNIIKLNVQCNTIEVSKMEEYTQFQETKIWNETGVNTEEIKKQKKKTSEKENMFGKVKKNNELKLKQEIKQQQKQQQICEQKIDEEHYKYQKILQVKKQSDKKRIKQRNSSRWMQNSKYVCSQCGCKANSIIKDVKKNSVSISNFHQNLTIKKQPSFDHQQLQNQSQNNLSSSKLNQKKELQKSQTESKLAQSFDLQQSLYLSNSKKVKGHTKGFNTQMDQISQEDNLQSILYKKKNYFRHSQDYKFINYQRFQRQKEKQKKRQKKEKRSSYINDIKYKNDVLETQQQGKANDLNLDLDDDDQNEDKYYNTRIQYKNIHYYEHFISLIVKNNSELPKSIPTYQKASVNQFQHFFQIINEVSQNPCPIYTQKHMFNLIQKNIYPILSELLKIIKKTKDNHNLYQILKTFPSLASIIINKFSMKYGVKNLANKHIKILLHCLRQAKKTTKNYEIFEILMFTDCKKNSSEDLFAYLLLMGVIDKHFLNPVLSSGDIKFVRKVCEQFLSEHSSIFHQLDLALEHQSVEQLRLGSIMREIIKGYRMYKIQRIEELGFLFIVLKNKNKQLLPFRRFVYFLTSLKLPIDTELVIIKKFMQNCNYREGDNLLIDQSAFTTFLVRCPELSFSILANQLLLFKVPQQNHPSLEYLRNSSKYCGNIARMTERNDEEVVTLIKNDKRQFLLEYLRMIDYEKQVSELMGLSVNFQQRNIDVFLVNQKQFYVYKRAIAKDQVETQFINESTNLKSLYY